MHTITALFHRLLAWLTELDGPVEMTPSDLCWSDLPPHHPGN